MIKSTYTLYQRGAIAMLDMISQKEGWENSRQHYLDIFFQEAGVWGNYRKRKYKTPEEAYEVQKKRAREYYWKKKGITAESLQERINAKRAENAMKADMKIINS